MSAAELFIQPLFIFPKKRLSPFLEKDGPAGVYTATQRIAESMKSFFLKWLHDFTEFAKPSVEEPILLILDIHTSNITYDI